MGLGGRDRSAMIEWQSRLDGPNGLILLLSLMTSLKSSWPYDPGPPRSRGARHKVLEQLGSFGLGTLLLSQRPQDPKTCLSTPVSRWAWPAPTPPIQ